MESNKENKAIFYDPESIEKAADFFRERSKLRKAGGGPKVLVDSGCYYFRGGRAESRAPAFFDTSRLALEESGPVIAVSPCNFNEISEISGDDMLAVCGGGVRIDDLKREAGGMGLSFPVGEYPCHDVTLSQLIDDGMISGLEPVYGGVREYILEVDIVTPAGEAVRSGSRAVKNVTGYDITAFAMGASGRCGLISAVTARLVPAYSRTGFLFCGGEEDELRGFSMKVRDAAGGACQRLFSRRAWILAGGADDEPGPEKAADADLKGGRWRKRSGSAVLEIRVDSESEREFAGIRERLHGAARGFGLNIRESRDGVSLKGLAGSLFKDSGAAALLAVSFDRSGGISRSPLRGVSWRTLFPERKNFIIPCRSGDTLRDLVEAPALRVLKGPGIERTRVRLSLLVKGGDKLVKLPVGTGRLRDFILKSGSERNSLGRMLQSLDSAEWHAGKTGRSSAEHAGAGGPVSENGTIKERIFELFDPHGLIIEK